MKITWLGHATVMLELDGVVILTDPVLRDRVGPLIRIASSSAPPRDPDCVLLSHLHADHADVPSLRRVARSVPLVAPVGSAGWLRRRGLDDVRELSPGSRLEIEGVRIEATSAVHDAGRRPLGPRAEPVGYLAIGGSNTAYFAGDTDLFEGMEELRGRVDVALLPVWGWGPRLGSGHLDPERAARAAALIAPRIAIPIHWGTFAPVWARTRMPAPDGPPLQFARMTRRYAPAVEVRILRPGELTRL